MIQTAQDLGNALIMMVDDEPITMDVVQTFLEEFGYSKFIQVPDALQAIEMVERHSPDVLLLDLIMPGRPGMEILAELRQNERFKHLPIVVLTASSDALDKLKALELGATDFLSKPVDQSELGLRIRNTLAAKAYMDQLVFYDPVTKLPNLNMFQLRFEWALKKARQSSKNLALFNITLDHFSRLNATVDLDSSNHILLTLATRLQILATDIDMLAGNAAGQQGTLGLFRVEGSTFTLLLDHPRTAETSAVIAKRILHAIREPIEINNTELIITASIGIATFPEEGADCDSLRRLSISAKNYSANNGGNRFQFSSKNINTDFEKRLMLETHLRKAFENNEFLLYYQPKIKVKDGEFEGMEALLRWNNKDLGLISPCEFIHIAEETKLIIPIGDWVLREACETLVSWTNNGKRPTTMAVNISPVQMEDPEFINKVQRILLESGVDPQYIKLEITESLLLEGTEGKIELLHALKKLGVQLSIDDFGTGYSSLSYLARLPVDELKIDRSFIIDVETNKESRAIISTIVYMAHTLKLTTVAEGIETLGQLEFIRSQQCDIFQGFYFSKPLPAKQLEILIPDK